MPEETALLRRHSSVKKSTDGLVAAPQSPRTSTTTSNGPLPAHSAILINRLRDLKHLIKGLSAYFDGVASLQEHSAKHYIKLGSDLSQIIPLSDHHQLSDASALQRLLATINRDSAAIAQEHNKLARTIESAVVQPLKDIRFEIKASVKSIQDEVSKMETDKDKWTTASSNAMVAFNHSLTVARARSVDLTARSEPYVAARNLKAVLLQEMYHDNELKRITIAWQQRCKNLEATVVKQLQDTWSTFDNCRTSSNAEMDKLFSHMHIAVATLTQDSEWAHLEKRGVMLDPQLSPRKAQDITFPGQADELVKEVKDSVLERKRRLTPSYKKGRFVLVPSGFLHGFDLKDEQADPSLSLYLPQCMLGPLSEPTAKTHKFWIGGNRATTSTLDRTVKKSFKLGASDIQYQFRFSSHLEMQSWWEECSKFCRASYTTLAKLQSAHAAQEEEEESIINKKASIEGAITDGEEDENYLSTDEITPEYELAEDATKVKIAEPVVSNHATQLYETRRKEAHQAPQIGDTPIIEGPTKSSDSRFTEHIAT